MAKAPGNSPDWRGGAPDPTRRPKHDWQKHGQVPTEVRSGRRSRAVKVMVTAVAFFGLLGTLIGLIYFLSPPPRTHVLLVHARYANNRALPHGEHYRGAVERVRAAWEAASPTTSFFTPKSEPARVVELIRELVWKDEIKPHLKSPGLIVYIAVHGGVDDVGPYLLPTDAEIYPTDPLGVGLPGSKMRLDDIFDALATKELEGKAKLLILDCAQMTAQPALGMIQNDFVAAVEKMVEARRGKIPKLAVLCSSGPNQKSWESNELKSTFFGAALAEALTAANKAMLDDRTNRVTVRSVARYVQKEVEARVRISRNAYQSPILLDTGDKNAIGEMELAPAGKSDLPKLVLFKPSDDQLKNLKREWERCDRLRAAVPHPATYYPETWREYLDLLLRAESLIRVGSEEGPAYLDRAAKAAVTFERSSKLKSATTSLALYRWRNPENPASDARETIDRFWKEELGLRPRAQGAATVKANAAELYEQAFAKLTGETSVDAFGTAVKTIFGKVADRIDAAEPGIRPSEAHLAYMLGVDLPAAPTNEHFQLLQRALKIRGLAERATFNLAAAGGAYPYPERVFPATGKMIADADQKRRFGEDLLFAPDAASLTKAQQHLDSAEAGYQKALATGDKLRAAFAVRDRAAWELPYFSRWVVQRRDDQLSAEIKALAVAWENLHQLETGLDRIGKPATLGQLPAAEPLTGDDLAGIVKTSTTVRGTLDRIKADIDAKVPQYTTADLGIRILQEVEPAMLLPIFAADKREQMLLRLAAYYSELLNKEPQTKAEEGSAATEAGLALQNAYRVGTLALAALGKANFDDDSLLLKVDKEKDRSAKYSTLESNLDKIKTAAAGGNLEQAVASVRDDRVTVGLQLSMRYRALPGRTKATLAAARTAAAERTPAVAQTFLSDRIGRMLDGAGAQKLEDSNPELTLRPGEAVRDLQAAHELLWLSARAADDHWFAVDKSSPDMPKRVPYFRPVANLLVEDAASFARHWLGPIQTAAFYDSDLATLKTKLTPDGLLNLTAIQAGPAGAVPLTTQRSVSVDYEIKPGPGWVGGFPVATLGGKDVELLAPESNQLKSTPVDLTAANATATGHPILISPFLGEAEKTPPLTPTRRDAVISIDAVFRGQRPTAEVRFALYPLAESILSRDPQPPAQSLFVYAADSLQKEFGLSNGAVVFVVDCSGSMKEYADPTKENPKDLNQVPEDQRRFFKVKETLKLALRQIPMGTRVSVWVYGNDKSIWGKDGQFPKAEGKEEPEPEATIEPLQKQPLVWRGIDSDQFKELVGRIDSLKPDGWTPLVRAMAEAKRDFANVRGLKTMIVLTDGMDSTFEANPDLLNRDPKVRQPGILGDPKFNPAGDKGKIPGFLIQQFAGTEIIPYLIGFQINDPKELAQVKTNFAGPIEDERVHGKFIDIKNADDLFKNLKLLLTQEMRYKLTQNNVMVREFQQSLQTGEDAKKVAIQGSPPDWIAGLNAGKYALSLSTNREDVLKKPVVLASSTNLLVRVERDTKSDGLMFTRDILANRFPPVERVDTEGWRISALAKFAGDDGSQQSLVAVEALPNQNEVELEFVRPQEVWIEGGDGSAAGPTRGLRWRTVFDWPAPVWQTEWPAGGPGDAKFQVWWDPKNTPYESKVQGVLKKDVDFAEAPKLVEGQGGKHTVGTSTLYFEEIGYQERYVRIKPGQPPEKRPCLVVRIRHDRDDPVWIHAINGGHEFEGEEHRFYKEANSMTALFWPASPDTPKQLASISLISVKGFKKYCESFRAKAELTVPAATTKEPPESMRVSIGKSPRSPAPKPRPKAP